MLSCCFWLFLKKNCTSSTNCMSTLHISCICLVFYNQFDHTSRAINCVQTPILSDAYHTSRHVLMYICYYIMHCTCISCIVILTTHSSPLPLFSSLVTLLFYFIHFFFAFLSYILFSPPLPPSPSSLPFLGQIAIFFLFPICQGFSGQWYVYLTRYVILFSYVIPIRFVCAATYMYCS